MKKIDRKNIIFSLALLAIIVFQGLVLNHWAAKDTRPSEWDQSIHILRAMEYEETVQDVGWRAFLQPAYFDYPPFYHANLIWALGIVDDANDAGALVNFIFFVVLIISVFLIGAHFFDRFRGLAAAFLVSCYPIVIKMSRQTLIDFALLSFVVLSIYLLIKTENFRRLYWSVGLGVVFGLTMLLKWTAFIYISGPLVLALYQGIKKRYFLSIGLMVLSLCLVAAPWYLCNLFLVFEQLLDATTQHPASGVYFGRWFNWLWYPITLIDQINIFFVLLFIPGVIQSIRKRKHLFLWLWLIVPFVLFSLLSNKNIRYTMPVLPAVALLSVSWISIKNQKLFWVFLSVILFVFIVFLRSPHSRGSLVYGAAKVTLFPVDRPYPADWKHNEIIDFVVHNRKKEDPFTRVVTLSNVPTFHSRTLEVTLKRKGIKNCSFRGPSRRRWMEFSEFILLKKGNLGPPKSIGRIQRCVEVIKDSPDWFSQVYKEVGRWRLPDHSDAVLFQAQPDPVMDMNLGLFNFSVDEMVIGRIRAEGVQLKAIPSSLEDVARGHLAELSLSSQKVEYKDLTFEDVNLTLINPQVNLPLFLEEQKIEFLRLGRLKPEGTINTKSLLAYADRKCKWLKDPHIFFGDSHILIRGKVALFPIELGANIEVRGRTLETKLTRFRIAHIPIPLFLFGSITDQQVDLNPNREMPFYFDLKNIRGMGEQLRLET
ncbi:hypothetical protein BVX98_02750 [bacterium F11]|nr:hypothetical protein BVX98_02750 [bacterium F11]